MIVLRRLQEQQLIQRWQILAEEVAGGYHSHLYRSKQRLWMHVKRTNTSQPISRYWHWFATSALEWKKYSYISQCPFNSKEWSTCTCQLLLQYYRMTPTAHPSHPSWYLKFSIIFVAYWLQLHFIFSGIGKATFLRYFYQHAEFISSGKYNLPGTLADAGIEGNKINSGFLAFLRLFGTV